MHEIERHVLIPIAGPFGIDLSVTNQVVLLWAAALVTFAVLALSCRRRGLVAHGVFQNLFEGLIEFVDIHVIREGVGEKGRAWTPFLLTLFFFILFSNLLGLVPVPSHVQAATSNINVTAALALVVFAVTIWISIRAHGFGGFLRKFAPEGVPGWVLPLVVPIEIVSWMAKPISLAIRLFANMLAGHAILLALVTMAVGAGWLVKPLPLAGAVAMSAFEIFVCSVQAIIFALLSGMYIGEALREAH
ncbi:F0F1 ATP synthase subunit A [Verrucomicrobiota bacterium]